LYTNLSDTIEGVFVLPKVRITSYPYVQECHIYLPYLLDMIPDGSAKLPGRVPG